jgi:hypothetical protein
MLNMSGKITGLEKKMLVRIVDSAGNVIASRPLQEGNSEFSFNFNHGTRFEIVDAEESVQPVQP